MFKALESKAWDSMDFQDFTTSNRPKRLRTLETTDFAIKYDSDAMLEALQTITDGEMTFDSQRIVFWVPWFLFSNGQQSYVKHCEFDGHLKYVGPSVSSEGQPEVSMEIIKDENHL